MDPTTICHKVSRHHNLRRSVIDLRRNLFPIIEKMGAVSDLSPAFIGSLLGHHLKYLEGQYGRLSSNYKENLIDLVEFFKEKKLKREILKPMLSLMVQFPGKKLPSILKSLKYQKHSREDIFTPQTQSYMIKSIYRYV